MDQPIDINKRVGQYVQLRDTIKKLDEEHKKKMAPYREALDNLNSVMLDHLNQIGGDNVKTEAGTVYRTTKRAASLADKTAFWAYVVATGDFDLIDVKANVTAVTEHVDTKGAPPPGVSLSSTSVVGVRRS